MATNADLLSYNAVNREHYVVSSLEKNFKEIRSKWEGQIGGQEQGQPVAGPSAGSVGGALLKSTVNKGLEQGDSVVESNLIFQSHIDKTINSYWKIMTPKCNNVDNTLALLNDSHQEILRTEMLCVIDFCARRHLDKANERKMELEQILADEFQRAQLILEFCLEDFKVQMETTIGDAVTEYRQLMHKEMLTLIQGPVSSITVDKLNESHEKIVHQLTPITNLAHRDWIRGEIRKRTVTDILGLKDVVESTLKYNGFMRRQFDLYTCLSVDKFNEMSSNCIQIITQSYERKNKDKERHKENNELLSLGLKHVARTTEARNKEIFEHELKQAEYAKKRILTFYNTEMKSRVDDNTFTRQNLRKMHEELANDCILTIKRVCNLSDVTGIPDQGKVLREELNKSFTTYLNLNDTKLKESIREIYVVVRRLKDVFVAGLKEKLKHCKISPLHFNIHRKEAFTEVNSLLEIEVAKYPHENFEFYKQTLKYLVDMEIPRLRAENDNTLNSNKDKPSTSTSGVSSKPKVKDAVQNNQTKEELEKQNQELEEEKKKKLEEKQKKEECEAAKREAERIMELRRDKWRLDKQRKLLKMQQPNP